jgi:hypothetical protein
MVNNNNRRNNARHVYNGKEDTLANLVREHGMVQYGTVQYRMSHGWDIGSALTTPPLS